MHLSSLAQAEALASAQLSAADADAAAAARAHSKLLVKPTGALGRLEHLATWMAAWQGNPHPQVKRPTVLVFAASHGVARHGVSAYPPEVTVQMVKVFQEGGAAINQLATLCNAEVRIGALTPDIPCADISEGPALSEREFLQALSYGMNSVAECRGSDLLILGEMGIGNSTAAAALCLTLFGGKPEDWVGPGTGLDSEGILRKRRIVAAARDANQAVLQASPLSKLQCLGGLELAALAGAILEARRRRMPVILDGFACTAAAATLAASTPGALDHCVIGHLSAEPGHALLLRKIAKAPILRLEMRLGEASGAATAFWIIRAALACHNGMAKMNDAKVTNRES
ncbi:MAG: nicotinate-nucleotide--dimethylbenzimidazole phosphoribosyltransferase [Alphaproteobacteria bacterium]